MVDLANDGAWFLPKRFGYGAGLPIAWQGWVLLGCYMATTFALTWLVASGDLAFKVVATLMFVIATGMIVEVSRRKTRGGWQWRWGTED